MSYYEKVVRVYSRDVHNINENETATFEKPTIVGYFSINKNREFVDDMSNLQYYYPRSSEQNLCLDLNAGIQNFVRKSHLHERLVHLLNFVLHHANRLFDKTQDRLFNTDFLCYRGLLTQIMCSMHLQDEWALCATKWRGNIYLCGLDVKQNINISQKEQYKFSSWGYKFEQYMLTAKPGVPPNTEGPIYEAEEFNCAYKSKLSNHSLFYVAELDGLQANQKITDDHPDLNDYEFVELKTSRVNYRITEDYTLKKFKFIKWWCQSYLVNINEIHVGVRDNEGLVKHIKVVQVKNIPSISEDLWSWRTCLNFCDIFLNIVKDTIPKATNDPLSVWKFRWHPRFHHFTVDEYHGKNEYSFLPDWFTDKFKNVSK